MLWYSARSLFFPACFSACVSSVSVQSNRSKNSLLDSALSLLFRLSFPLTYSMVWRYVSLWNCWTWIAPESSWRTRLPVCPFRSSRVFPSCYLVWLLLSCRILLKMSRNSADLLFPGVSPAGSKCLLCSILMDDQQKLGLSSLSLVVLLGSRQRGQFSLFLHSQCFWLPSSNGKNEQRYV